MKSLVLLTVALLTLIIANNGFGRDFKLFDAKTGNQIDIKKMAENSSKFDVIFFGEFHDDSIIHGIQKAYLEEFIKLNPKTAVSLEMFERDAQPVIDKYLKDEINEEEFLKASRPWPDYKKFYRSLVEIAKENKLPVIAANIPRKYASMYASGGMTAINKLPKEERHLVTRDIKIENDEYLERFYKIMLQNMGLDTNMNLKPNQENTLYLYYGAQVIKDETMAESIYDFLDEDDDYKIIHFNGDFHSNNYMGTAKKLLDRDDDLEIAIITPDYVEKDKEISYDETYYGKTDFLLIIHELKHPEVTQAMMGGHLGENYAKKHKINIDINPETSEISGSDVIEFANPIMIKSSLSVLKDIQIDKITSPQGKINYEVKPTDDNQYNDIILSRDDEEITTIEVRYKGKVYNSPNELQLNQRHSNTVGIISAKQGEGIYLPKCSYYPAADKDLSDFDITVSVPSEFTIITSGKLESTTEDDGKKIYRFLSELPADDFILVGGRYKQKDTVYSGVTFKLFTFGDLKSGETYLTESIKYYDYYTKLLGPYPYSSFSIVENFFATGFGMPAYTLLSNKLMALPWVLFTPGSLAHEFVHNWWGNSVYTTYDKGNWCEALTSYSTNYYYNVITNNQAGALDWRKKALISIALLPESVNYPVKDFKYQSNNDDAVIGYQKGAFIFYEINKLMGDSSFFRGIRAFAEKYKGKRALWLSLINTINSQAKKDSLDLSISPIFNKWLNEKKIPELKLTGVSVSNDTLFFNINQDADFTTLVPVQITTDKGTTVTNHLIKFEENSFNVKLDGNPVSIQVDKDYQVLRKLNNWEIPYSLSQILFNKPLMILPSKSSADYKVAEELAKMMIEGEYKIDYKSVDELVSSDWAERSVIVVGNPKSNSFFSNLTDKYPQKTDVTSDNIILNGSKMNLTGNVLLMNFKHPVHQTSFATVICTDKMDDIAPYRRLFRYMSYSAVLLAKDRQGRPLGQMEIFPDWGDRSTMIYGFGK
jgi:uncharacterized iron-regulated protein